jgi:hypothetical protein
MIKRRLPTKEFYLLVWSVFDKMQVKYGTKKGIRNSKIKLVIDE